MAAAGLDSLFPMTELSVMGFAEVVPSLPRLAMRLVETVRAARHTSPSLVVGIDSKAFNLRVLRHLAADFSSRDPHCAFVQYVAPSAWAFADAPKRAMRLAETVRLDELLVLLPFEVPLFTAAGIRTTFVGHPALDKRLEPGLDAESAPPPSRAHAASAPPRALCLLAGSRADEVDANLPIMLKAAEQIAAGVVEGSRMEGGRMEGSWDERAYGTIAGCAHDGRGFTDDDAPSAWRTELPHASRAHRGYGSIEQLLLPTPPSVRALVEAHLRTRPPGALPATVVADTDRHHVFAQSHLALACCGTVNVELANARLPQVALYRSSRLTSWVVRRLIRPTIPFATLPNIIRHFQHEEVGACAPSAAATVKDAIPECLFEACTADAVAEEALGLLRNPRAAVAQADAAHEAVRSLVPREPDGRELTSATIAARALMRHLPHADVMHPKGVWTCR